MNSETHDSGTVRWLGPDGWNPEKIFSTFSATAELAHPWLPQKHAWLLGCASHMVAERCEKSSLDSSHVVPAIGCGKGLALRGVDSARGCSVVAPAAPKVV